MKSRKTRCTGHVAHIWQERCIQGLVGKPEEMRLLGRPRHKWKYNNKIDLQEEGWRGGRQPELIWLRTGMGARTCECSNETLASTGMQGTS